MRRMTRLFIAATVAMTNFSLAVQAADLRAPVPPPVYVPSWTGFYIGGSAGYGWSNSEVNPSGTTAFCNPVELGCLPNPPLNANVLTNAQVAAIPPALATRPRGGLLGGQFGYNYQAGALVVGVETDISWTDIEGTDTRFGGPVAVFGFPGDTVTATATADQRLRYFGTVRGRLGWVPVQPLLAYVTGGLAYGQITSSTTVTETLSNPLLGFALSCFCTSTTAALGTVSTTRTGWTLGGGLEYAFAQNWSLKGEYLYFNLGNVSYAAGTMTATDAIFGNVASTVAVASRTTDFTGNIVRFGVNYKFGS